jgi:hypothetical protein
MEGRARTSTQALKQLARPNSCQSSTEDVEEWAVRCVQLVGAGVDVGCGRGQGEGEGASHAPKGHRQLVSRADLVAGRVQVELGLWL